MNELTVDIRARGAAQVQQTVTRTVSAVESGARAINNQAVATRRANQENRVANQQMRELTTRAKEVQSAVTDVITTFASMSPIGGNIANTVSSLSRLGDSSPGVLRTGVAIAGTATALWEVTKASISAYSEYRRLEIGLQSNTGSKDVGSKLAKSMRDFALQSAYGTSEVYRQSQYMLAMTNDAANLEKRMRMVANLTAAAGGDTEMFGRLSTAVSQIASAGRFLGQDRNQLAQAGVSMPMLAKELGMSTKQLLESEGSVTSERILAALDRMAAAKGDVQGQLSREIPTIAWQNTVEVFVASLIPAGQVMGIFSNHVLGVAQVVGTVWSQMNNLSHGLPVLALLFIGARYVVRGFSELRQDLIAARIALRSFAAQANAGPTGTGSVGTAAGIASKIASTPSGNAAMASASAFAGKYAKPSAAMVASAEAGVATKVGAKLGGAALAEFIPVIGQAIGLGLLAWSLWDLVTEATAKTPATPERPTQSGPPAAIVPHSRSDWENVYYGGLGTGY